MTRTGRTITRGRLALVTAVAAVLCVVAGTAGVAGGRALARQEKSATVYVEAGGARRRVVLRGEQTVTSVLIMAGVVPRVGRLLSARKHAVLDPELHPAKLEVDGRTADETTPVLDGMTVKVLDGTDAIEGPVAKVVALPAPPLPDVLRHVYRRGRPGLAREVSGELSHEVISRSVLAEPVAPTQVTDRVVALTFDDGPTTQWTPTILQVLASRGVKATFCEVGRLVDYHPQVSHQIVDAGHQLCNHTLDHVEGLAGATPDVVEQQIAGGADAQTRHGLPAPSYYRPPGGSLGPDVIATARSHGEAVLFWKVDTEDWRTTATPARILHNLETEVDPGAIILMHDGGGKSRVVSVLTLGAVIDWLKAHGYSFVFPVID